jgi:hypothetical protein
VKLGDIFGPPWYVVQPNMEAPADPPGTVLIGTATESLFTIQVCQEDMDDRANADYELADLIVRTVNKFHDKPGELL